jgi:hypothetical protein
MACNSHGPPTLEPQPDGPASHHDPKEEATRTDLALVNDISVESRYYGFPDDLWFPIEDTNLIISTPAEGFEYYRTPEPDSFAINFNPRSPNDAKAYSSYTMVPAGQSIDILTAIPSYPVIIIFLGRVRPHILFQTSLGVLAMNLQLTLKL